MQSSVSNLSNDYYELNAGTFVADTIDVDMTPLYGRFQPLLRARILYAGCGSATLRRGWTRRPSQRSAKALPLT
jgi:hypothetical protein